MAQPLAGITVLDLGQYYQGPYCGFLLAMAGADVIKVEPPGGESLRQRTGGASYPQALINSNKRGVTLNLKDPRGRALLERMAQRADVLIENFAPGVMDRLGIGCERLRALNPPLVYASGTGFGLSGPDRDGLAMDIVVQAFGGMMSVTGFEDGPPVKAGPAVIDFLSGTHLYGGVMTALFERERTGQGKLVEVAMQDAAFPSLASNLGMMYHGKRTVPPRTGNRHGGLAVAPYNVYEAKDGHVAIICTKEQHWRAVLAAMGREDLVEHPDFNRNKVRARRMHETDDFVERWTRTLTRDEFFRLAKRHGIPAAPVRDVREVLADEHMRERGMLQPIDHPDLGPVVVPNSPIRYHGSTPPDLAPSPSLGQHNHDVYGTWLGIPEEELKALRKAGVL